MTRRKVELAWITNQSARRTSLKKRRVSLLKKVMELTTLCGIKASLVIYSPGEHEPMVWPSPDETKELIRKFQFVPELERLKKTTTMEKYMSENLSKVHNDLTKLNTKIKEAKVRQLMLQIHHGKMMDDFNIHELEALIWFGEIRRTTLRKRVEFNKQLSHYLVGPSMGDVPLQTLSQGPTTPYYDIGGANVGIGDNERVVATSMARDNWFHNSMNPDEFRGGSSSNCLQSYMRLSHYNPFVGFGRSIVVPQLELPSSLIDGNSSVAAQLSLPESLIGRSSIANVADLGLWGPSIGGSSSAATEHGQPGHPSGGDISGVAADLELPGPSSGSNLRVVPNQELSLFPTSDHSMFDVGFPECGYSGFLGGQDMGPGHYPLGPVSSTPPPSELNPFGFYGGENSSSIATNCKTAAGSENKPSEDKK